MRLVVKGKPSDLSRDLVGRVVFGEEGSSTLRMEGGTGLNGSMDEIHRAFLTTAAAPGALLPTVYALDTIEHLEEGDIVLIQRNGLVRTVFRTASPDNTLFTTDQCNSNCLMCSQPPRDVDDIRYHYEINCRVIDLIPGHTETIGVTGGEPTLMGELFFDLIERLSSRLPATVAHVLTNGRAFAHRSFTERFRRVNTPQVVLGIPLYSDYYARHDYVVQARGAFDQTLHGLHNLGRAGARIELRVVLHKLTYERLPQLAKFIFMNLPFVEQVSLMGLEYTGYTPHNDKLLWIEPKEYVGQLTRAVEYLDGNGISVSIYNHPLCTIPETLWKYSAKSISDWKRQYPEECGKCLVRDACGGVFATSKKISSHIRPVVAI